MPSPAARSSERFRHVVLAVLAVLMLGFDSAAAPAAESLQQLQARSAGAHRHPVVRAVTRAVAGASVFLQGDFIEVGIHPAGSFGSADQAPEGFHPGAGEALLGFVVDPLGFATDPGPRLSGDFFVPGTPEEMWGVRWTSDDGTFTRNQAGLVGVADIATDPGFPSDISSGRDLRSLWQGTAVGVVGEGVGDHLQITQTVHFDVSDKFLVVNVVLTNAGAATLRAVRYMRSVDPDQEEDVTGDFTTNNFVAFQPPRGDHPGFPAGNTNKALVEAVGLAHGVTLGLGTIDARARVCYGGFTNRDPDDVLDLGGGLTDTARAGAPDTGDEAISLAFDLGDLAPGQSTTLDYAYVLNADDLDLALGSLGRVTILQPTGSASGTAALFQVTTANPASATVRVDFSVAGVPVGSDATASAAGTFETTFDTTGLGGTVTLLAVATFADGTTSSKSASVVIDNTGPPIAFGDPTPSDGAILAAGSVAVAVISTDGDNPPTRMTLFREVAGVATVIGELSTAPFLADLPLVDLPAGSTVVLKAVAANAAGASTTITRTFLTFSPVRVAPPIAFTDPTPADGAILTGAGVPVAVSALDSGNLPTDIRIFRVVGDASTLVAEAATTAVGLTVDLSDLPPSTPVRIEAVASNGGEAVTIIDRDFATAPLPPPLAFAAPTPPDGAVLAGASVDVAVLGTDPLDPPSLVTITRQVGETTIVVGTRDAPPFTATVPLDDLPSGATVVVHAIGANAAATTTDIARTFAIAVTGPPIAFVDPTPAAGATLAAASVAVAVDDGDAGNLPTRVTFFRQVGEESVQFADLTAPPFVATMPLADLHGGAAAVLTVIAGNARLGSTTITRDFAIAVTGPPVAFADPTPAEGAILGAASVPVAVAGTALDNAPVHVVFFRDSGLSSLLIADVAGPPFTTTLAVGDLPVGDGVALRAVATNARGGSATITRNLVVSAAGHPGPALAFVEPTPGEGAALAGASAAIAIAGTDAENPPTAVTFFRDVGAITTLVAATADQPFAATVPVDDLPTGTALVVRVVAVNALKGTTTITRNFVIAVAGPPTAFTVPTPDEDAALAATDVAVAVTGTDPANPPARVRFFREAGGTSTLLADVAEPPFTATLPVADLANGAAVVLKAVASNARLGSSTLTRNFVITVAGPPLAFVAPTPDAGAAVGDTTVGVTVAGTEEGNSPVEVALFREVDGIQALVADLTAAPFTALVPLGDLVDGTPVVLKAVATNARRGTTTITRGLVVAVAGPAVAFAAPTPDDGAALLTGTSEVAVTASDAGEGPVTVRFFRDAAGASTLVAERTAPPFAATLSVADLDSGTQVVVRAVAVNARLGATTIGRSFAVAASSGTAGAGVAVPLAAPAVAVSSGKTAIYNSLCPSTVEGLARFRALLAGRTTSEMRAFSWDAVTQSYVEFPAEPGGGLSVGSGILIASRSGIALDLSGTSAGLAYATTLKPGWNFVGMPVFTIGGGPQTVHSFPRNFQVVFDGRLVESFADLADLMGTPGSGDASTAQPFFWDGSAFSQHADLLSGLGYWIKNNQERDILLIRTGALTPASLSAVRGGRSSRAAMTRTIGRGTDRGTPPRPPGSASAAAPASSGGGCGHGSFQAGFLIFALLLLRVRQLRRG